MAKNFWTTVGSVTGSVLGAIVGGPIGAIEGAAIGGGLGHTKDKSDTQKRRTKRDVAAIQNVTNQYEQLYQTAAAQTRSQQAKSQRGYINALRARSGGRGFLGDDTLG